jgi:hypothetical protein
MKPEWYAYYDDGPTSPIPSFKIKVKDDIQSPIALLPVQTPKGKKTQARRANLIVRLVNGYFRQAGQERTCVYCGCTDSNACQGGCSWVETHKHTPTGVCSMCTASIIGLQRLDVGKVILIMSKEARQKGKVWVEPTDGTGMFISMAKLESTIKKFFKTQF